MKIKDLKNIINDEAMVEIYHEDNLGYTVKNHNVFMGHFGDIPKRYLDFEICDGGIDNIIGGSSNIGIHCIGNLPLLDKMRYLLNYTDELNNEKLTMLVEDIYLDVANKKE